MKEVNGKKAFTNILWRLAERFGAQGVTVIVEIVLARVLDPKIYGTVALVTVFTTILQVFVDSGLGTALVQKKDADQLDFSTVFFANIITCIVLYFLMFFSAPLIAKFYGVPELTNITRVTSLIVVISGVKNIQQAYVSRNLLFKKFFFATLGGTVGAAIIGIWMAYSGFGVWALVCQMLFNQAVDTLILWITVKWRPSFKFSFERLKTLLSFGWKLLASQLLETVYNDLRALVIGKLYTESDLAFYNRGQMFPQFLTNNTNSAINSVLLPVMAQAQDDKKRVKEMTRRAIKISSYVIWPMMVALAACAEPIVDIVLTDKWLPCVFFLRIFCVSFAFYPIHTANLNAIKALGRSDIYLKLEIWKKIIGTIILVSTMWFGVKIMAYSVLLSSLASQIINTWPNKKLLNYGYFEQIKDILPSILISLFMGAAIYPFHFLHLNSIFILLIQMVVGIGLYLLASVLFKIDSFSYLRELLHNYRSKQ